MIISDGRSPRDGNVLHAICSCGWEPYCQARRSVKLFELTQTYSLPWQRRTRANVTPRRRSQCSSNGQCSRTRDFSEELNHFSFAWQTSFPPGGFHIFVKTRGYTTRSDHPLLSFGDFIAMRWLPVFVLQIFQPDGRLCGRLCSWSQRPAAVRCW